MKVLLKHSVRSLGRAGEVVSVKDGYARNYLLPKGFAVSSSQANVALIEKYTQRRQEEEAQQIENYKDAAQKINEFEIVMHLKANASNHLYGSVGRGDIVTQLNNRHVNIEKDMVQLEHPIKELGNYDISIRLAEGIEATLKVDIRDEHGEIPVLEGSLELEQEETTNEDDQVSPGADSDLEEETTSTEQQSTQN